MWVTKVTNEIKNATPSETTPKQHNRICMNKKYVKTKGVKAPQRGGCKVYKHSGDLCTDRWGFMEESGEALNILKKATDKRYECKTSASFLPHLYNGTHHIFLAITFCLPLRERCTFIW